MNLHPLRHVAVTCLLLIAFAGLTAAAYMTEQTHQENAYVNSATEEQPVRFVQLVPNGVAFEPTKGENAVAIVDGTSFEKLFIFVSVEPHGAAPNELLSIEGVDQDPRFHIDGINAHSPLTGIFPYADNNAAINIKFSKTQDANNFYKNKRIVVLGIPKI
ncbi:MAG: hypothetical protein KKA90_00995 [Nanoarchaeota archaeon]|nr:hypothetical protein [Nanoarchaeota archaeon]